MVTVMGWDIGGANVKAARLVRAGGEVQDRRDLTCPLELWREPERLPQVLGEMAASLGGAPWHAVTMTAELVDAFASRREGVAFVLESSTGALTGRIRVWCTDRRFHPPAAVLAADPLGAAATNWLALAERVARARIDGLIIDMGSTTTDLIPVARGRVAACTTDPERLAAGQLVYTGALRTPVPAVVREIPLAGRRLRVAAEHFAVMGDVNLVLGRITAGEYTCSTPDGRPPSLESAVGRLARLACTDTEHVGPEDALAIARWAAEAQAIQLVEAALQVLSVPGHWALPVLGAGLGRFAGREVARRLELPYHDLADLLGNGGQAAGAEAAAWLLAEEVPA